jgi:hypothetical protein
MALRWSKGVGRGPQLSPRHHHQRPAPMRPPTAVVRLMEIRMMHRSTSDEPPTSDPNLPSAAADQTMKAALSCQEGYSGAFWAEGDTVCARRLAITFVASYVYLADPSRGPPARVDIVSVCCIAALCSALRLHSTRLWDASGHPCQANYASRVAHHLQRLLPSSAGTPSRGSNQETSSSPCDGGGSTNKIRPAVVSGPHQIKKRKTSRESLKRGTTGMCNSPDRVVP